jgi:phosphatidylglycerol lysyltransferase
MSSPPASRRRSRFAALLRVARSRTVRRVGSALFFGAAAWLIWRQLAGVSVQAFLHALGATNPLAVLASILLTFSSYLCLSGSEWLALHALGHRFGYWRAARVAIPAYALTNSAGFSPATGTALRIRMYGRLGLPPLQSAEVAMLAGAAVTVSGVVATGLVRIVDPSIGRAAARGQEAAGAVVLLGALMAAPAVLWFVAFGPHAPAWLGGRAQGRLSARQRLAGLGAGLGDWLFSSAALFVLLPHPDPAAFAGYFAAYAAGCILSAATGVPGGIGVFEAIVLTITSMISKTHETAAALLLYRAIYSLGPLALWGAYAAFGYVRRKAGSP